jgi:uncharacterized protein (DUF433 family)
MNTSLLDDKDSFGRTLSLLSRDSIHPELRRRERWASDLSSGQYPRAASTFDPPFSVVLSRAIKGFSDIAVDGNVLAGKPRIAGTRIPVYMVLDALLFHGTLQGVLESYSQLTLEQVKNAVEFAAAILEQPIE